MSEQWMQRLQALSTPHLADACLRVGVPVRCAPSDLQGIRVDLHCGGRVCPVRHAGSVDIFLEALEGAQPGDILVVDDQGRRDRACVGDMIAREVKMAGLGGIVIWGCHRDTRELLEIGLPFFSQGALPTGPLGLEERPSGALESAQVGDWTVTRNDVAVGDCDGVIFLPYDRLEELIPAAEAIRDTEKRQAAQMRQGKSLRAQLAFDQFLRRREQDGNYGFREHLRNIGGAVEE